MLLLEMALLICGVLQCIETAAFSSIFTCACGCGWEKWLLLLMLPLVLAGLDTEAGSEAAAGAEAWLEPSLNRAKCSASREGARPQFCMSVARSTTCTPAH